MSQSFGEIKRVHLRQVLYTCHILSLFTFICSIIIIIFQAFFFIISLFLSILSFIFETVYLALQVLYLSWSEHWTGSQEKYIFCTSLNVTYLLCLFGSFILSLQIFNFLP